MIVFCECGFRTTRNVIKFESFYDNLYGYHKGVFGKCDCGKNFSPYKYWSKRLRGVSNEFYIERHIEISDDNCWEWTGTTNRFGYGVASNNNAIQAAHRLSWKVFKGNIPDGLNVCHTCDNRRCVNPFHLFLGTQKENLDDMVRKNRMRKFRKLSKEDISDIKRLRNDGYTTVHIGSLYNVSHTTISRYTKGDVKIATQ